jgi:hypothetical protein
MCLRDTYVISYMKFTRSLAKGSLRPETHLMEWRVFVDDFPDDELGGPYNVQKSLKLFQNNHVSL